MSSQQPGAAADAAAAAAATERAVSALAGTWVGTGSVLRPDGSVRVRYTETVALSPIPGKPLLSYAQKTAELLLAEGEGEGEGGGGAGRPLHAESGFVRMGGAVRGRAEVVLAQPTGVASVEEGTLKLKAKEEDKAEDKEPLLVMAVATSGMVRSASAKAPHADAFRREFTVAAGGAELSYTMHLAAGGEPEYLHLQASLKKQ